MEINVKLKGASTVVYVSGDVDVSSSPKLRNTLLDLFRNRGQQMVIVELSEVGQTDSSCIASLLEGLQEAKKQNARLILVGLQERLRNLLELTRLLGIFEIRPSETDALAE